jgi:riboflavin kinase / FMN adenylyltransferase
MSVVSLESVNGLLSRSAVTIGVFDGVHLGHRALLNALLEEARRIEGQSVVLTFDTHPAQTVRPEHAPKFICTLEQRIAILEATGADVIVVAKFDEAIAGMSPRMFFEQVLLDRLKAAVVVVGPDFRFGKGRVGDFGKLAELGVEHGTAAVAIMPVMVDDAPVSSTRIRTLLRHGDVASSARLLGRPFVLEGTVVKGDALGRRLGFPTANLCVPAEQILPADGVYSGDVAVMGEMYPTLISIGTRPTVGGASLVIEAHIIGFDRDIYGERIRLGFRSWLRGQKKFANLDQLVRQMKLDLEVAQATPGVDASSFTH